MFRSIRWTLQLWHAAILALALVSFAIALYMEVRNAQIHRIDAELEGAARVLASGPAAMPSGFGHGGGPPPWVDFGDHGGDPVHGGPGPNDGQQTFSGVAASAAASIHGGPTPANGQWPDNGMPPARPGSHPDDWWAELPQYILRWTGLKDQDQPYFAIWNADGSLIRASPTATPIPLPASRPGGRALISDPPQIRHRGVLREVIVPGLFGIQVLVGKSVASENLALNHFAWTLLAAGSAVMIVGLFGGWLLSNRAIRPIRAITQTAQKISASDLSRRINVRETTSELGSLALTLNETFNRLETAFQRQIRFTADASHELRTPLSVIYSHIQLALSKERSSEEYHNTIEVCSRAARRMKSLIESLLELARADAGRLDLKLEQFDLKDLAEECLSLAAPQAAERNIQLESQLQSVQVKADRTRISQVITNLLSNAIRYNRKNGTVDFRIESDAGQAVIRVADTGVGISASDQSRMFERFFRADKARSREVGGSGLGLAICQSIIEAHGGTITFESQSDKGTTFTVRLGPYK